MVRSNNEDNASSGEVEAPVSFGMGSSPGAGGMETSNGGISLGGAVPGAGTGSGASGSNETRKGTGGLSSSSKGASSGGGARLSGKRFEPATPAAPVKIPETLRHRGRPYRESEIYWEIDRYVLHGPDLQMGIAVPGNEICREGDLLRTRETFVFTQVETDMKRCFQKHPSEGEVIECPSKAETRVVTYNDYLSSPVNYTVHTCLIYDKTHCSLADPGRFGTDFLPRHQQI